MSMTLGNGPGQINPGGPIRGYVPGSGGVTWTEGDPQPGGITGIGTPNPPGYGNPGPVQVVSGQEGPWPLPPGATPDPGDTSYGNPPQAIQLTGGSAGAVPVSAQGYNQGPVGPAVASGPAAVQPTYVQASPGGAVPLFGPSATGFLSFIRRRL